MVSTKATIRTLNEILIKIFSEELDVEIKEDDLGRTHRMEKPKRQENKLDPQLLCLLVVLLEKKSL